MKDLTLDFSNPKWDENVLDDKHTVVPIANACLSTRVVA